MAKKIKNTSKQDPLLNLLAAAGSNGIEAQEAQGQKELAQSSQLPTDCLSFDKKELESQYEKMGIKVIGLTKGDSLFYDVILPTGWQIKPTAHSMWSDLVDELDRKRAAIFYKAAFYDRSAHISFNTRFNVSCEYGIGTSSSDNFYERKNNEPRFGRVTDNGEVVFKTEEVKYTEKYTEEAHDKWWSGYSNLEAKLRKEAEDWVTKDYPKYKDINAYWD